MLSVFCEVWFSRSGTALIHAVKKKKRYLSSTFFFLLLSTRRIKKKKIHFHFKTQEIWSYLFFAGKQHYHNTSTVCLKIITYFVIDRNHICCIITIINQSRKYRKDTFYLERTVLMFFFQQITNTSNDEKYM